MRWNPRPHRPKQRTRSYNTQETPPTTKSASVQGTKGAWPISTADATDQVQSEGLAVWIHQPQKQICESILMISTVGVEDWFLDYSKWPMFVVLCIVWGLTKRTQQFSSQTDNYFARYCVYQSTTLMQIRILAGDFGTWALCRHKKTWRSRK